MTNGVLVIRGDTRALPLPDASVDLVVTSPPYFALRSYTDGGQHYAGQIGSEPTPAEYIAALVECTREWIRVLKPSGSIWVNLGDKYSTGTSGDRNNGFNERSGNAPGKRAQERSQVKSAPVRSMPPKSLLLLPERYRIAAVDQLGLIARAVVIWSKPNGLPESVQDRVRRSHEDWVHLTKQPRYYSAVDEIREQHARIWTPGKNGSTRAALAAIGSQYDGLAMSRPHPLGKLPGSVWEIATEPLKVPEHLGVDHFAAFPTEWPKRIILGWSPPGICTKCGEGRRPVVIRHHERPRGDWNPARNIENRPVGLARPSFLGSLAGETCACAEPTAPTRPAVVLDPFSGTGTTVLVASALGRHGIGVDMSADYCRLARWRVNDPAQRAKVLGVPKPPEQPEGQADLFAELEAS